MHKRRTIQPIQPVRSQQTGQNPIPSSLANSLPAQTGLDPLLTATVRLLPGANRQTDPHSVPQPVSAGRDEGDRGTQWGRRGEDGSESLAVGEVVGEREREGARV